MRVLTKAGELSHRVKLINCMFKKNCIRCKVHMLERKKKHGTMRQSSFHATLKRPSQDALQFKGIKEHTQTAFSPKMMTANSCSAFHLDFWAINHFRTCLVLLILVSL